MEVRELRDEVLALFGGVAERFKQVDRQLAELKEQIAAEGQESRRYFTIAVEQMKAERNLALDQSAGNTKRLDDHERRIRSLERRK